MAFCTTYKTILDSNIRNIYSGLPSEIRFRIPSFSPTIDHAKRMHELQLQPPDAFDLRYLVSVPGHNVKIPRAPAFRVFSEAEVNEIVKRVSRPTCSAKSRREVCKREVERSKKDMCAYCELSRLPDDISKRRVDDITRRLLTTPTISSTIRNNMRDKRRYSLSAVHGPCTKVLVRPYTRSGIRSAPS